MAKISLYDILHSFGPSIDTHCGVACTFQPVTNAAVNMGVQICFSLLSVLWVLYPEVGYSWFYTQK